MNNTDAQTILHIQPHVTHVATAIRKLAIASSVHLGNDCFLHMELGRTLLADLGIRTDCRLGFAAWRVGSGDADVVSHVPYVQGYAPTGVQAFAYHSWLTHDSIIIDFTTYQLRIKARQLDAHDGGHTNVDWCPEFLMLSPGAVKKYRQVANASQAGTAYYEARPELNWMLDPRSSLDPSVLEVARLLLVNPHLTVIGPNDVGTARGDVYESC